MADEIRIRLVAVEFLRPGPPHNQLLSPLTQYLAACGDAGAGVVTVPYEHATFERRLKELRYETGDSDDRLAMLHDVGVDMGRILGSVPGLPGALTIEPNSPGTLIQLRLTLSASELAHLPFELAKVPVGPNATAESWLAIQTRPPVCVTRNIRTVSPEGVLWPRKPRVLFVSGDPDTVPFDEHRDALVAAIRDFQYPGRDDPVVSMEGVREQFGDLLTILRHPTLANVLRECRDMAYTHVHILAHGDHIESSPDSYGLVLRSDDDSADVVSGERFATALTSISGTCIHRPTVVTIASCDSANVGTITIPGASFAHALHQAGVPLVVASQFPLSKEASIPLAQGLYHGLLWGEHPILLLQRVRAELHARYTSQWHDWASLVVYEALPQALDEQLDSVRYFQAKRALNAALERVDRTVQGTNAESLATLDDAIERVVNRLPLDGQYAIECLGLRASSRKRLAQAAFELAAKAPPGTNEHWKDPLDLLEQARRDYERAVRGLLVNDSRTVQRVATLHWVLVQLVSLAAVLGKHDENDAARRTAARLCAELYRDHSELEERAWAQGSLAELGLLGLCQPDLSDEDRQRIARSALDHADQLVRAYPARDEFPVQSTLRQFQRYVDWWGSARFEEGLAARGLSRQPSWAACGLIDTAKQLVAKLDRNTFAPGTGGSSVPPASSPGRRASPPASSAADASRSRAKRGSAASVLATPRGQDARERHRAGPFFDIEMLPAGHGDALWIEYGDDRACHRWLVDCGTQQTARHLMHRVDGLPPDERLLELFVMSHIDADHIGGALPFFAAVQRGLRFGDLWFNGWRHLSGGLGARQGEMFSTAIQDFGIPWNRWRDGAAIVLDDELPVHVLPGGMKLTLLSPTAPMLRKLAPVWTRELKKHGLTPGARVDYSRFLKGAPSTSTNVDKLADEPFSSDPGVPNGTSIALLAEYGGHCALLAADAHAPVLAESVRRLLQQRGVARLKVDAFKLPHHGSRNNLSIELLELLDCKRYLVSSNGDHFYHPDRQAIGRIIKYGGASPTLHFNYRSRYNEVWARPDLQEKYAYTANYPQPDAPGTTVSMMAGNG